MPKFTPRLALLFYVDILREDERLVREDGAAPRVADERRHFEAVFVGGSASVTPVVVAAVLREYRGGESEENEKGESVLTHVTST